MDPSAIASNVTVKATYDYKANNPDELSFCKHAIITNVCKNTDTPGWWKGDYGGAKQLYFPQNFVQEVEVSDGQDTDDVVSTMHISCLIFFLCAKIAEIKTFIHCIFSKYLIIFIRLGSFYRDLEIKHQTIYLRVQISLRLRKMAAPVSYD